MNNAILFFFNINPKELKELNENYYFNHLNEDYVVHSYKRDPEEIKEIYSLNLELLESGVIGYEILITKDNNILFIYNNKYYVLMKLPNIENRIITYEDIKNFSYIPRQKLITLDKSNWSNNWSNKIDFIEYQFRQMNKKYKIIDNSINYFIGLWENAISYFNNNYVYQEKKYVSHKRITIDMDLLEYLNPMNFVIDYKERDIGEFLKSYVLNNNYSKESIDKYLNYFSKEKVYLLISRVLFPSYYFDIYEDIILNNVEEEQINEVINKKDNIIYLLYLMFDKYKNYNITEIEWIKKEINLLGLI